MSTIKVEVQFSSEDLLKVVEQLSQSDLKKFIAQAIAIQAQRTTSSLMQRESELLLKINKSIPLDIHKYYKDLIAKRNAEILTNDEYKELLRLTEQIEKQQAERIGYLAELASLKGISLSKLMENLGIQTQSYV
jgi:hypothetical protein